MKNHYEVWALGYKGDSITDTDIQLWGDMQSRDLAMLSAISLFTYDDVIEQITKQGDLDRVGDVDQFNIVAEKVNPFGETIDVVISSWVEKGRV